MQKKKTINIRFQHRRCFGQNTFIAARSRVRGGVHDSNITQLFFFYIHLGSCCVSLPLRERERKMWSSSCEVIANATAQNKENVGGALRARCPVCSPMLRSQNVPGFSPGGDRAEVPQKLHERTAFLLHSLLGFFFFSFLRWRPWLL